MNLSQNAEIAVLVVMLVFAAFLFASSAIGRIQFTERKLDKEEIVTTYLVGLIVMFVAFHLFSDYAHLVSMVIGILAGALVVSIVGQIIRAIRKR